MSKFIKQDLFREAFDNRKNRSQETFEKLKVKFIAAVQADPAESLRWGASVAEAQFELRAMAYAESYLSSGKYGSNRLAIEAAVESLTQHIIINVSNGASTSEFSNGVDRAALVGTRRVLVELKYLLDHPAA